MDKALKERVKTLEKNVKDGDIYKKKKKKFKKVSNKRLYLLTLNNFQMFICTLISRINGMDDDTFVYADKNSIILNGAPKLNKNFKKISKLDWRTPKDINSLTFRGRFATILLLEILKNSNSIVKSIWKETGGDHRWAEQNEILSEWMFQINIFICSFTSSDISYYSSLMSIIDMLEIEEDVEDKTTTKIYNVKTLLEKSDQYTDGIIFNDIAKLGYVLSTGSVNVKKTPKYKKDLNKRDDKFMLSQMGILGYAILSYRKKHKNVPLLYKVFQEANPEIWTRFGEIDDLPEVSVALKSLFLVKLIMEDKNASKIIDSYILN